MRTLICAVFALLGICVIAYTTTVLAAAQPAAAVPANPAADEATTYTGVLIDNACAERYMKKDDPEAAAASHPKSCALKPGCAASGYCIITGKKLIKFDDASNKMAKEYLEKDGSVTKVSITGTLDKDGILSVKTLDAAKEAK